MAKNNFTQCRLIKKTESGVLEMVSFIPEELAITGNCLSLKNSKGEWQDNWIVESAGIMLPEEQLQIYRDVYRHTRNASDA